MCFVVIDTARGIRGIGETVFCGHHCFETFEVESGLSEETGILIIERHLV